MDSVEPTIKRINVQCAQLAVPNNLFVVIIVPKVVLTRKNILIGVLNHVNMFALTVIDVAAIAGKCAMRAYIRALTV